MPNYENFKVISEHFKVVFQTFKVISGTLKYLKFGSDVHISHFCRKRDGQMSGKFFNIIPSADSTACLLLYGYVGTDEKVDSAAVVAELMSLEASYKHIDVRINSLGGEVFSGIAIYNALRQSRSDINIYVDGVAASIASIIALCGKPLHMSRFSRLMLHQVSGGAYGTAKEMREAADTADNIQKTLCGMIAERCHLTAEEVESKYFDGADHWITAQEALAMGLIDSIYDIDEAKPEEGLSNEAIYEFTNRLSIRPQKSNNMAFIDELKKKDSFKDASTESQMLQHIDQLENEAAKVPALQNKVTELENQIKEQRKSAHETLVNQAVEDGRISNDRKGDYLALLEANEASAVAVINGLPKKNLRAADFINHPGGGDKSDLVKMSWDEIDRAGRLAELKSQYPDLYKSKFDETFKK